MLSVSQEGRWRPFIIRPTPSPLMKPLLVFVNPKSGGNQVGTAPHPSFPGAFRENLIPSPPFTPSWAWFPQPRASPHLHPPPLTPPPCPLSPPGLPQGAKIIQSFLWYLNPRQVFDLSQGGPKEA